MVESILQEYGFSQKEAKIYISCLKLGSSLASSIARYAEENRGTVYSILKDLQQKWIVLEVVKNKTKYFSVISPEQLVEKQERKIEKMKRTMPELMAMANSHNNKPKIFYFEGVEKLKELFIDILDENAGGEILAFVGTVDMDPRLKDFLINDFIELRRTKNIVTKAIVADNFSDYSLYHSQEYQSIYVDDPVFEMGNEIAMYGEKNVAVLNYSENEVYGLVIESPGLNKSLKSIFNIIWKQQAWKA